MAQCRDLENHHHEKLLEISINTLEKILKGELDEDLPYDVCAVSTVGGAVAAVGGARAQWARRRWWAGLTPPLPRPHRSPKADWHRSQTDAVGPALWLW